MSNTKTAEEWARIMNFSADNDQVSIINRIITTTRADERQKATRSALAFIKDNVEEVHNDIGGVVGYVLHMNAEETEKLMTMLEKGSP